MTTLCTMCSDSKCMVRSAQDAYTDLMIATLNEHREINRGGENRERMRTYIADNMNARRHIEAYVLAGYRTPPATGEAATLAQGQPVPEPRSRR